MNKVFAAIAFVSIVAIAGCSAPDRTVRVLEAQGYTNITTHGYAFLACSQDDTFATSFKATSPAGKQVSGAVCSGLFKGNTIRFD